MATPPPLQIDFLQYQSALKTRRAQNKTWLWGSIRQKYLVLQPEELVRQLTLCYLIDGKGYNKNRISVEKGLKINDLSKRCDILVYDSDMRPFLLVECKAPEVPLTQATFEQIARYNMPLQVEYLLVTNGRQSYCCQLDYDSEQFTFLEAIPEWPNLPHPPTQ